MAVDCDQAANKPLCGRHDVKGFPTLKIARPGPKLGRPGFDDYQGGRSAKAMTQAVLEKLPNHVTRLTEKTYAQWHDGDARDAPKAILFSDKGVTSNTYKALASDFFGKIQFAQVRDKERGLVERFGIESFPKLVLVPPKDEEHVVYDGEMTKDAMLAFLSQVSPLNEPVSKSKDKKSKKAKDTSKKTQTKDKEASEKEAKFAKASVSHKAVEAEAAQTSAMSMTVEEGELPVETPEARVKTDSSSWPTVLLDESAQLPRLESLETLRQKCLQPSSGISVLLLAPEPRDGDNGLSEPAVQALDALVAVARKHAQRNAKLWPFYVVTNEESTASQIAVHLDLEQASQPTIVAIHGKKGWWKTYAGSSFTTDDVEAWIDSVRMGEGAKKKLPPALLDVPAAKLSTETAPEPSPDAAADDSSKPVVRDQTRDESGEVVDSDDTVPAHSEL